MSLRLVLLEREDSVVLAVFFDRKIKATTMVSVDKVSFWDRRPILGIMPGIGCLDLYYRYGGIDGGVP